MVSRFNTNSTRFAAHLNHPHNHSSKVNTAQITAALVGLHSIYVAEHNHAGHQMTAKSLELKTDTSSLDGG